MALAVAFELWWEESQRPNALPSSIPWEISLLCWGLSSWQGQRGVARAFQAAFAGSFVAWAAKSAGLRQSVSWSLCLSRSWHLGFQFIWIHFDSFRFTHVISQGSSFAWTVAWSHAGLALARPHTVGRIGLSAATERSLSACPLRFGTRG